MNLSATIRGTIEKEYPVVETFENGRRVFTLSAESVPDGYETLDFMPGFATAPAGTDGYLVVPAISPCCFLVRFTEHRDAEFIPYQEQKSVMPIYGMKRGEEAFVVIVTGMSYEFDLVSGVRKGVYYQYPRFNLYGQRPYEDIRVEVITLKGEDASYAGMARAYRNYQLDRKACVPLREKVKGNDVLKYNVDSVEIRLRNGWKPAPSPVMEQTPETEPPMKVAMTFDKVREVVEACHSRGLRELEWCLVGWNKSGHDGRWPQIFPVEEALGGEAELRVLINRARELGYCIVGHTNNRDAYSIADSWDEEYLLKKQDGSLVLDPGRWSGGRTYLICPQRAWERFAKEDLKKIAELGFRGLHYIDVLSIVAPQHCFDPAHPCTSRESAEWLKKIMIQAGKEIGGFASEGGIDHFCGELDSALYVGFRSLKSPDILDTEPIPLWQLVYHGITLYNPSSETVNYMIKSPDIRLRFIEYGGKPVVYYYSKFMGNGNFWMGVEDCTCDDEESFAAGIDQIQKTLEEYRKLRHLQYEFMEDHRKIGEGVYETLYSNGTRITVDYNRGCYTVNGQTVSVVPEESVP
jgi:hypothetical protein